LVNKAIGYVSVDRIEFQNIHSFKVFIQALVI